MALLKGKTAVITGGSTGVGLATAKRFVEEGAYVFINGRSQAELDAAVEEIGGNVTGVQGDGSKPGDRDRLYDAVADAGRRLDVVFANAAAIDVARSARAPGTPGMETSVNSTVTAQPHRLGQPWVREIVPGVFRVGTTFSGCYVVEDAGAYTFFDVGLPGYWPQMTRFLAERNAPLSSVKAIVLTHHHPDHMGNAERLRTQTGATVFVHHDDRAAAMSKGKPPSFPLWKPPVAHLVGHFLLNGVTRAAPVTETSDFTDEEVLNIPGRPRVIHVPGHTAGNVALSLDDREVLIVGDTLATLSLSHGESEPQLLPRYMNDDHDRALASLEKIEPVKARWVLPAHGFPWEGSPQHAVKLARQLAARTS